MDPRDLSPRPARPTRRFADAATSLRRRVLRRRRPVAVVLVGVAVVAALRTAAPPDPPTTALLVAARDLPAGQAIAASDLAEVAVPPGVVPEGVAGDPVGRLLAAPLRKGEPVTDVRLVGAGLTTGTLGTVALPVRLSDAGQASLLTAGDQIDLIATDPQARTTTTLTERATVLAVPSGASASDGALSGRLVVLGVPSEEVRRVTGAAVTAFVSYTWSRS